MGFMIPYREFKIGVQEPLEVILELGCKIP